MTWVERELVRLRHKRALDLIRAIDIHNTLPAGWRHDADHAALHDATAAYDRATSGLRGTLRERR